MPPKKATTTAAAAKAAPKTKVAPKSANTKATRAPSKGSASVVSTTVTKTTTTIKATKRKASEIEDDASVPNAKKSKATPTVEPKAAKTATKKAPAAKAASKVPAKKTAKAAAPEKVAAKKRQSEAEESEESEVEPAPKKAKVAKAAPKAAAKKVTKAAPKAKTAPKKTESKKAEQTDDEDAKPAPKVKAAPKPKKVAPPKPVKALPTINKVPTQVLDVFVFGEGGSGELGLGARKGADGKKVIDVTRPRLNPLLSAKDVGVVCIAVGGMHSVALTRDNKILTWGVNDQGALGRATPNEGKMVDLPEAGKEDDSDSDSDDDDSGLNPSEAEPRQIDPSHFPEGTLFASVHAGDSTTFALTNTGLVYGWGTFRGNDGIIGFRSGVHTQSTPILIPELKDITNIAVGTNHVLALNTKGKVFTWGAGEQSQLARRVVSRTAIGALIPREFGLQRKKIVHIGCGDYHSFAVDNKGAVYSWGLNSFGQTGVPKDEETVENAIATPTVVKSLSDFDIKQIAGGAHHTLACTSTGQVLVWGRIDGDQAGVEMEDLNQEHLFLDEHGKPRYLIKPNVVPDIEAVYVATGPDTCLAVDKDGKAYTWGFSSNYQTGQGTAEDVVEATWVDNSAVRGKKIVYGGIGGQFGVLGGVHVDE
ncbi:hypothetical protein ONS95_011876 [Cadophora gregata]|uniref:uncharacterized protein n=1 Tax=Cadophora gregata TaxID=51156 RepID=UPI0026DD3220|nr:uncharacterized protein ONS95_011876 [Cadophora gregata]KAK0117537.1 hypothetical protein ONS95_011876 [Cadophora gregata]KAK0122590.1 hypothetical protein ONS96_009631 [Cadophora gregata f. sp. sojae]